MNMSKMSTTNSRVIEAVYRGLYPLNSLFPDLVFIHVQHLCAQMSEYNKKRHNFWHKSLFT